jgi:hypothetical protein
MSDVVDPPVDGRRWSTDLGRWIAESRAHRVICLLFGIWLFNAFDLVFTVMSHQHGLLHEENPLARVMLDLGTPSVVLFKIGLVLIGTYPFLRFRRERIAELGAYTILAAYAILAVHWSLCFEWYTVTFIHELNVANVANAPACVGVAP